VWNEDIAAFVPKSAPPGLAVAGAASGTMLLSTCLTEGSEAGRVAATDAGFRAVASPPPPVDDETWRELTVAARAINVLVEPPGPKSG